MADRIRITKEYLEVAANRMKQKHSAAERLFRVLIRCHLQRLYRFFYSVRFELHASELVWSRKPKKNVFRDEEDEEKIRKFLGDTSTLSDRSLHSRIRYGADTSALSTAAGEASLALNRGRNIPGGGRFLGVGHRGGSAGAAVSDKGLKKVIKLREIV